MDVGGRLLSTVAAWSALLFWGGAVITALQMGSCPTPAVPSFPVFRGPPLSKGIAHPCPLPSQKLGDSGFSGALECMDVKVEPPGLAPAGGRSLCWHW